LISLKNVSVSFGEKMVLDNFSFELQNDGVTCFSGPSGCGKTTLFRVIAGLCPIQSGSFQSDFTKTAFMFQEDRLLPWLTAVQNVASVLPDGNLEAALLWLSRVGLENEKDIFPAELSGGMRRRVALARTLAYGGDLMLFDEPFKGLDPSLTEKMSSLIAAQSAASLVITHSHDECRLLGGRLIRFDGPPLTFTV
jgi:ABC-type nitrate/sulfonate/bicarbonate transport system ATPase subunit